MNMNMYALVRFLDKKSFITRFTMWRFLLLHVFITRLYTFFYWGQLLLVMKISEHILINSLTCILRSRLYSPLSLFVAKVNFTFYSRLLFIFIFLRWIEMIYFHVLETIEIIMIRKL